MRATPDRATSLLADFEKHFRKRAEVLASAPAIVRLLGDDVGVEDGVILAGALPLTAHVAATRRDDRRAFLRSTATGGETALNLDRLERTWGWTDPIAGVAVAIEQAGCRMPGFELYVDNPIPVGAGLGSSAALASAAAAVLAPMAGLETRGLELASLCRRGAAVFAEVPGPFAPHAAAALARPGELVLLDAAQGSVTTIPVRFEACRLVIADSGYRRPASATEIDRWREAADRALEAVRATMPAIGGFRDLEGESLPDALEPRHARRCRHFASETARALDSAAILEDGELTLLGRSMAASQESLRLAFAPVPPEIDGLVRLMSASPGVAGARSCDGAGATSSVAALVDAGSLPALLERLERFHYRCAPGQAPVLVFDRFAGATTASCIDAHIPP